MSVTVSRACSRTHQALTDPDRVRQDRAIRILAGATSKVGKSAVAMAAGGQRRDARAVRDLCGSLGMQSKRRGCPLQGDPVGLRWKCFAI
jgi:hypothetical protein